MKKYTLNNGVEIPEIGFGTWQTPDGEMAVKAVKSALKEGYRHVDAAAAYKNEKSLGIALAESGIPRSELFITSKLWNTERGYDSTLKAFEQTLSDLGLEYLDLYLIHWPANAQQFENWQALNADTWRAMEKLYQEGKIKAIGVSNFLIHHLEALLQTATVVPAVNQIEFHPGQMQVELAAFCKQHHIQIEGWSPLGTGKLLSNKQLLQIAQKYQISVAQLCIKWALQHGVLPLPKTVSVDRIRENLDVYGFELSREDVEAIDALPYIGGSGLNPDTVDF